jgi:hypothetical protein
MFCINRKCREVALVLRISVYNQIYSHLCSSNFNELTGYWCTDLRNYVSRFLTGFIQQQGVISLETEHAVMGKQRQRIYCVCSACKPRKNALDFVISLADIV